MEHSNKHYLYRFDNLASLRKQRISDPVLRGRRSLGNEPFFPHHQIRSELAIINNENAVYRLSFWKTWDDMLLNLWSHQAGSALKRIPENHPSLCAFKRDHDEYLENYAWIYWNAMPVDLDNSDWSPIGIPHDDIEVLHPDGRWLPMNKIPCLSAITEDGWKPYYVHGSYAPTSLYVATRNDIENGHTLVMICQCFGSLLHLLNSLHILTQLVAAVIKDFAFSPEAARWIYTVEYDNQIRAEEFYPRFSTPQIGFLKGIINHFRGMEPPQNIAIDYDTMHLSDSEIQTLYELFGISEYIRRGEQWSYKHLLLPLNDLQTLREMKSR